MKFSMGMVAAHAAAAGPFSPTDKSALINLSSSNSVATRSGAAARWVAARSSTSKSAGKWYFEITVSALSATAGGYTIGIMNSTAPVDNGGQCYPGATSGSIGYNADADVFQNGAVIATLSPYAVGDVIGVAFDAGALKVWFRIGAGIWNGGGDPVAGTGSLPLPANPNFAAVGFFDAPAAAFLNVGQAAFANAAPTGYSALG